jgi:hypothetical protein
MTEGPAEHGRGAGPEDPGYEAEDPGRGPDDPGGCDAEGPGD